MNDFKMTDILKGFDKAATPDKDKPLTEITPAKDKITDGAQMKKILEGLDASQKSVNQMPATHKMAKSTATKHPASNFLVGGEEGEPEAGQEVVAEAGNLRSVKVTFSDGNTITTDMAANLSDKQIQDYYQVGKSFNLGDGAGGDNMVTVSNVEVLDSARDKQRQQAMGHQSMGSVDLDNQNNDLKDGVGENTDSLLTKKQSLKDIFRSMDEAEADKTSHLEKEFHSKLKEKSPLTKGDNGKFDLAEKEVEESNTISSGQGSDIDRLVTELAHALFKEGVQLAKEVWEVEGEEAGYADSELDYVKQASKKFLDPGYQREIMANIREEYKELVRDNFFPGNK